MRQIYTPDDFDLQLFSGSGAGLNRAGPHKLLEASGINQTIDSGPQMIDGTAFSKWVFQLTSFTGTATGWSVTCYGTINGLARTNPALLNTWDWTAIVAPSGQSEAGGFVWANPLVSIGQHLYSSVPWVAVRVVATSTGAATGDILVLGFAVP